MRAHDGKGIDTKIDWTRRSGRPTADLPITWHAHEEHSDMNVMNIVTGLTNHQLANATGHENCRSLILIGASETRNAVHSHKSRRMLPP